MKKNLCIWVFKGKVHPKNEDFVIITYTLKLFQTCMRFFLLLNTK